MTLLIFLALFWGIVLCAMAAFPVLYKPKRKHTEVARSWMLDTVFRTGIPLVGNFDTNIFRVRILGKATTEQVSKIRNAIDNFVKERPDIRVVLELEE